jgi:hypothetical protein
MKPSTARLAPTSAIEDGSGTPLPPPPPAVAEPIVMSANAIWFSVPVKSADSAVPLKVTPMAS